MNYINVWVQNRNTSCLCDWCLGHFKPIKQDWSIVEWDNFATHHTPGITLNKADACCAGSPALAPKFDIKFQLHNIAQFAGTGKELGCICVKCNSKNEFAEPNQPNGKYICFECR